MTTATALEPAPAVPPERNGADALYEVVNGEYVELRPMSTRAIVIASRLHGLLWPFAAQHALGEVVSEALFPLDTKGKLKRRPDVAFVSYQRWDRARPLPNTDPWPVVPDLAVEVVSPNDQAEELRTKVVEYFRSGARLVWVVYPQLRLVDVYDSPTSMRTFGESDQLDGGAVLPGLQIALGTVFAGGAGQDPAAP